MSSFESDGFSTSTVTPVARNVVVLAPAAAALSYPYLLKGFHFSVSPADTPLSGAAMLAAAIFLLGAIAVPAFALAFASRLSRVVTPSRFELRARRLAYLSICAPPLFVFVGVTIGLLGLPMKDESIWAVGWLVACAYTWMGSTKERATSPPNPPIKLRVGHGISAAVITVFILFHLTNHLLGWLGPDAHAAVMEIGRSVYRAPIFETILIALLLFQAISGGRLAWYWTAVPSDAYRAFQIGSGAYLAAFLVTHLNSALVSARAVRNIETDWAWASGAPEGLIYDAWNIRLLPHYALGVFFVLAHLTSGLRQVLLAHGVAAQSVNRIWIVGLTLSGLVSTVIVSGLCGARI